MHKESSYLLSQDKTEGFFPRSDAATFPASVYRQLILILILKFVLFQKSRGMYQKVELFQLGSLMSCFE